MPPWKFGDIGAMLVHRSKLSEVKRALQDAAPCSRKLGKRSGVKGWYNKNAATWLEKEGSEFFYIGVSSSGAAALQQVEGHTIPDNIKTILPLVEWKPGHRREAEPACPNPVRKDSKFTFSDLFCGIGGFRIGGEEVGGSCVYSVESERMSRAVYNKNFGQLPEGRDITQVHTLPEHDILTAGFPCGPFTLAAGQNRQGFDDPRGLLYLQITRLLETSRPKAFLLENVPGVQQESVLICKSLEDAGYTTKMFLRHATGMLPQARRRALFIGFRQDLKLGSYNPPEIPDFNRTARHALEQREDFSEYILTDNVLRKILEANSARVRGGNRMVDLTKKIHTLQASYRSNPIQYSQFVQEKDYTRYLTERECARAQGFPDTFSLCPSRPYYHIGNALPPPLSALMLHHIAAHLNGVEGDEKWLPGWGASARLALRSDAVPDETKENTVVLPDGREMTMRELSEVKVDHF